MATILEKIVDETASTPGGSAVQGGLIFEGISRL